MAFTPEQQERINRFQAIVQFASQQTGVVQVATVRAQQVTKPDGTARHEVDGELVYAIVANWQPPPPEAKEYPKDDAPDGDAP